MITTIFSPNIIESNNIDCATMRTVNHADQLYYSIVRCTKK